MLFASHSLMHLFSLCVLVKTLFLLTNFDWHCIGDQAVPSRFAGGSVRPVPRHWAGLDSSMPMKDVAFGPTADNRPNEEGRIEWAAAMIADAARGASGDPTDLSSAIKRRDLGG